MKGLYSFANLGGTELGLFRLHGVGLANCLFPWARCVLASQEFRLRRIASTWPQLCHRQWIRWDRDKRTYVGLMDERNAAIGGPRKLALLARQPRIAERDFLADPESFHRGVIFFRGIDGYFSSMLEDHARVRAALIGATRPQHRPPTDTPRSICIHVRYGDATDPDSEKARMRTSHHHLRQRIGWFIHALNECRRQLGPSTPALVFSDASDQELRPLLALPGVRRVFFGSAIADLLALSTASLLIASGSTFSLWAAYLGRMPVLWPSRQRHQRLHGDQVEYEPEIEFGPLPDSFASLIRRRLRDPQSVGAALA
jgi:hypothetical protein